MLDIKWIRENPEAFDAAMQNRNQEIRAEDLLKIDEQKRQTVTVIQEFQSERNFIVGQIAILKKNGDNADQLMEKSKVINLEIKKLEEDLSGFDELEGFLLQIPNIQSAEVPVGNDENDNQEVER